MHPTELTPTAQQASRFERLVDEHKRSIYYLALDLTGNHHDAEDLSQDVFIRAYRHLDQFRGDGSAFGWLHRITVNTFLNSRRSKVRSIIRPFSDRPGTDASTSESSVDPAYPGSGPSPERQAESRDLDRRINGALDTLSDRERAAFVLRHYQDRSLSEIADTMEIATGTVKSLLFRSTKKMRDALSDIAADWRGTN